MAAAVAAARQQQQHFLNSIPAAIQKLLGKDRCSAPNTCRYQYFIKNV